MIAPDPGHVSFCGQRGDVPDRYVGNLRSARDRDVAVVELAQRELHSPLLEAFGEELADGSAPFELLLLEVRFELLLEVLGEACGDRAHDVYYVHMLTRLVVDERSVPTE